jgi:hypothetical protein
LEVGNNHLKIEHVMADGTVRKSIDGLTIPVLESTAGYYRFIAEHIRNEVNKKRPNPAPEKQRVTVVEG